MGDIVKNCRKILLVDDDDHVGKWLQEWMLAKQIDDLQLFIQSDPSRVLDEIRNITPDLILLDYGMPKINGIDLMNQINEVFGQGEIPIAFLSNYANQRERAIRCGAIDFFPKAEISLFDLTKKIRDLAFYANSDNRISSEKLDAEDFIDGFKSESSDDDC